MNVLTAAALQLQPKGKTVCVLPLLGESTGL
jgi:hypothetical protein